MVLEQTSVWSYDILKQIALEDEPPSRTLEHLKMCFSNEIQSTRRMCCIATIGDLIDCLERRDVLSESKIEPFQIIAMQTNNHVLQKALRSYVVPRDPKRGNQYRLERRREVLHPHLQQTATVTPPPVVFAERRPAICKLLSRELGNYWRKLGRELEIGEGILDEIEVQFPRDLASRVVKMLQHFEEDSVHDPQYHFQVLCKALEIAERKDLRRKLEKLTSH